MGVLINAVNNFFIKHQFLKGSVKLYHKKNYKSVFRPKIQAVFAINKNKNYKIACFQIRKLSMIQFIIYQQLRKV